MTAVAAPIIADTRQLLTSSRLRAARSCRRQHHLAYDLGIRPVGEADTTRFGSLFHAGQEWWWRGAQSGVTGDALLTTALTAMEQAAGPETDAYELVRAEVLLTGYHERWEPSLADYEVLGVEVEFTCELVNPTTHQASRTWKLGGKMDVIVRERATGRVLVVEHKTSSEDISQGSEYWRRLRMDGQISVYFVGAHSLGHDVAGCLYDVIGKPALRPAKATPPELRKYTKAKAGEPSRLYAGQREADETPEEFRARLLEHVAEAPDRYFQRGDVVRLEQEMKDALLDIWQLAQELRQAELAERFPRNPGACVQYGRTCPYFDACTGCASLDDTARFQRGAQHPELTQVQQ